MIKKKLLVILLFFISYLQPACEHFERRMQSNTEDPSDNSFAIKSKLINKNKIHELEKTLETKDDKKLYSKLLPWFTSDEERISYLSQNSFEARQLWVQTSGILERQNSMSQKYKTLIEGQDIAIGMPIDLVRKSWGEPAQVEVSGNPLYKNEKWRYINSVSSSEGFKQEGKTIYFENGKVVGWETE